MTIQERIEKLREWTSHSIEHSHVHVCIPTDFMKETIAAIETHPTYELESLYVTNLNPEDFERFHGHKITYSGSTGAYATAKQYPAFMAYIATYLFTLPAALHALKWENPQLIKFGHAWRLRRG